MERAIKDRVVILADELIPHLRGPLIARQVEHISKRSGSMDVAVRVCCAQAQHRSLEREAAVPPRG